MNLTRPILVELNLKDLIELSVVENLKDSAVVVANLVDSAGNLT